ncbi:hypothetical protein MYAM1_001101 [Malassezia yamatoensis]|uniref:[histone H3]-trimethyl-L-lysine(4) demethylase n=1 Tax=Malassezia yamatoensis TaxID=253288 RepID=A0AAJ5YQ06_9BASI|nr:hypothetical protein MYAM1_001101 [Malassezia yamatoensis]
MARALDGSNSESAGLSASAQRHATRKVLKLPPLPRLAYDHMESAHEMTDATPIATSATTPRHAKRSKPRVFELEEAPTFYPTWEQFQDPMAYIEWIASPKGGNGVDYGIVKVVPPEGWRMEFVLDEQTFRFRTRVQRLNELSAEGRVTQNFREQLEQFHAQQGQGRLDIPRFNSRPLDLYALRLAAKSQNDGNWTAIALTLGIEDPDAPLKLRHVYEQYIAPFEQYRTETKQQRAASTSSITTDNAAKPEPADLACDVCHAGDTHGTVRCVDCAKVYHRKCASLPEVPRGDWVCASCLVGTGGDFGFEDGETHSLHSFWQRCSEFQRLWARRAAVREHNDPHKAQQWSRLPTRSNTDATLVEDEDLIEAEFWRLVQSHEELVDVEYGADVHSSIHGNASPTVECQPRNPYARSGWNMNNLPILPASLLRYIKSEISGMTVPWIYIGMMFSAFCWHNEDHYTYSVNYQHWGATKTWYGVPGADAAKFEAAMQHIAPELFESCPDLLLQLVTMMSPALCKREGVRTYACNQRPNEFVITFPKAYHSGFNQGFNLNEAVNFALPDWVMDGLACAQRYQSFARQPVFSHDELLITIALHNQQLSTAVWLQNAYREMVEREIEARNTVRAMDIAEECAEYDRREQEYQCQHCKTLCYLSQVVSRETEAVACPMHVCEVHKDSDEAHWVLRLRYPDAYLETQAAKLTERAAIPYTWQERIRKFLSQHPRPPLRTLQSLVQEGEKIAFPLPELSQLQPFVRRATEWVQRVELFLTRRQKRSENAPKPRGRGRGRRDISSKIDSTHQADSPKPSDHMKQDRSPEALLELCAQVPHLPFETPEFSSLQAVVEQMDAFRNDSAHFLKRNPEDLDAHHRVDDAERVLGQGSLLQVEMPEVVALRRWIAHAKWYSEVHEVSNKSLSLEDVDELLAEAQQAGIQSDHPQIQALTLRRQRGEAWGTRARELLDEAPVIERSALDELLDIPHDVATWTELRMRVVSMQVKAVQWHELSASIYNRTHPSPNTSAAATKEPAYLSEARQLLDEAKAARVPLPFADEITEGINLHDRWNAELAQILRKNNPKNKNGDVVEIARNFCEHTARAASATALREWEEYMNWKQEAEHAEKVEKAETAKQADEAKEAEKAGKNSSPSPIAASMSASQTPQSLVAQNTPSTRMPATSEAHITPAAQTDSRHEEAESVSSTDAIPNREQPLDDDAPLDGSRERIDAKSTQADSSICQGAEAKSVQSDSKEPEPMATDLSTPLQANLVQTSDSVPSATKSPLSESISDIQIQPAHQPNQTHTLPDRVNSETRQDTHVAETHSSHARKEEGTLGTNEVNSGRTLLSNATKSPIPPQNATENVSQNPAELLPAGKNESSDQNTEQTQADKPLSQHSEPKDAEKQPAKPIPIVPMSGAAQRPKGDATNIPNPPAACICFETLAERTPSVTCTTCQTLYHLKCLDLRAKSLEKEWQCPFCDKAKLPPLLQQRHAVSQLPLVALLQNAAMQRDRFRFLPSNYTLLQAAVRATVEFGVAVTMRFRSGVLPSELQQAPRTTDLRPTPLLKEITRRGVACPVDVLLIADATPMHNVPSVLDAMLPAFDIRPENRPAERKMKSNAESSSRPSRRTKRARLTFREEKSLKSLEDDRVHCFCSEPDAGTMVQCDKCALWFHNACVCVEDIAALQDKWFCPICCLRMRRRYPHAEVRIVDETPSAPTPPLPPNLFVDLQATLKSETATVHKVQHWTNERRVILHLIDFEPAVIVPTGSSKQSSEATVDTKSQPPHSKPLPVARAPPADLNAPPAKRARLSSHEDSHFVGRLNLLRRGVSEAMMQRYAMGWNGEAIVCQLSPDRQVVLGPSIRLAPDDLDGTRLLRMALEAAWRPAYPNPAQADTGRNLPAPIPSMERNPNRISYPSSLHLNPPSARVPERPWPNSSNTTSHGAASPLPNSVGQSSLPALSNFSHGTSTVISSSPRPTPGSTPFHLPRNPLKTLEELRRPTVGSIPEARRPAFDSITPSLPTPISSDPRSESRATGSAGSPPRLGAGSTMENDLPHTQQTKPMVKTPEPTRDS